VRTHRIGKQRVTKVMRYVILLLFMLKSNTVQKKTLAVKKFGEKAAAKDW